MKIILLIRLYTYACINIMGFTLLVLLYTQLNCVVQSLSNVKYIATKQLKWQIFLVGLRLTINGALWARTFTLWPFARESWFTLTEMQPNPGKRSPSELYVMCIIIYKLAEHSKYYIYIIEHFTAWMMLCTKTLD